MGNKPSGESHPQFENEEQALAYHQNQLAADQTNAQPLDKEKLMQQYQQSQQQQSQQHQSQHQQQQSQQQQAPAQPQTIGASSEPTHSSSDPTTLSQNPLHPLHRSPTKVGLDDFELMTVIGKGSFGKVFSVRKKDTGKIYAMKVLKKDDILRKKQVAHTQAERRILENIDHPFIVSLHFAFQTPDKLYFILDLFTGGELFFHLKTYGRFNEQMAVFYAAELALALDCLHSHNIIYRDLKPENILLDQDGHIKVTDFGLSKEVSDPDQGMTICGTPEYLAYEVVSHTGPADTLRYTKAVDYWALGTLIYEMVSGIPPFYHENVTVMYQRIISAPLQFPPGIISPEGQDFISQLLIRDPEKRLGSGPQGIENIKNHPWFKIFGLDFNYLLNKQIVPPFRPSSDQLNIDQEFQQLPVADTPCQTNSKSRLKFPQFSYQAPENGLNGESAF